MKKAVLVAGAFAIVLVLIVVVIVRRPAGPGDDLASSPASTRSAVADEPAHPTYLHGRVTTVGGVSYEGRLRWGGDEEAFWDNHFDARKVENSWVAHVPPDRLPEREKSIKIFGVVARRSKGLDLGRPFMARFGDIARVDVGDGKTLVTLKSGTAVRIDRFEASDFDDGVRVWDATRGVVDLEPSRIRTIELLPSEAPGADPGRLFGTVRVRQAEFTGYIQWDREDYVGRDELHGQTEDGELRPRFDTIRSIARRSQDSALVTLVDGSEIVLSGTRNVGDGHRGIYVYDPRYGRVRISWNDFESVEFSPGGDGPVHDDFPPGGPLGGSVTTRAGQTYTGRLVFDLDESEITDTLDAPLQGVDYTIPFGLVASIEAAAGDPSVRLVLQDGEALPLERSGDLGESNAGMLIFVDGQDVEYVPWADVEQIEFERPTAMYPPLDHSSVSGANES